MMLSYLKQFADRSILLTCAGLACMSSSSGAQVVQAEPVVPSATWQSGRATELIGFPGVKENTRGALALSPTSLTFTSTSGISSVERVKILSATAGFERKESGGTVGRVSRVVIPFGGGSALAATATNKEVGLLTIEFRDEHSALRAAVFMLPKAEAFQAEERFGPRAQGKVAAQPQATCDATGRPQPPAVMIEPLVTEGLSVPTEYRALLYEELIAKLEESNTFAAVYRTGDDSAAAACSVYHLTLALEGFSKGNAALRASTGPVGFFVGATSLNVHILVQNQHGSRLFDKDMKVSERGDTESLNVANKIATSLSKDLKKQMKAQASTTAPAT